MLIYQKDLSTYAQIFPACEKFKYGSCAFNSFLLLDNRTVF
jgi:hypothetical protein